MPKSSASKKKFPATLPTWPQTVALGIANAEHVMCSLVKLRAADADWSSDDWACDTAIDLALATIQRMQQQSYKNSGEFERDWFQVAGVVNLAAKCFSERNRVYASTLASLVNLMDVLPELVEHSWE